MSRLILHVGVPKTGSSAIQSFLCRHSSLEMMNGERLTYGVIRHSELILGRHLRIGAMLRPLGYTPASEDLAEVLRVLTDKDFRHGPLLLSQESWYVKPDALKALAFDVPIEIVIFVRPQVEWLSSAWWQWFAWTNRDGNPVHAWRVLRDEGALDWSGIAKRFSENPNVEKVSVRLFAPDTNIIDDFLSCIHAKSPQGLRSSSFRRNASLTTHHVALYKALPWLRPVNGGSMDALLTKIWPFGDRPPMDFSHELVGEVIDEMRDSNEDLTELLPPEQAKKLRQDLRWWDAQAYFS